MNTEVFSILQSPDDGTPIGSDLTSEGGIRYEVTESGILMLHSRDTRLCDAVYTSPKFEKWNMIINERIRYYTGKQTVAGLVANWGYRSLRFFNQRSTGEWLLDIGCGDGVHVAQLKDRSTYIGLDRNLDRLEILKKNYPEVTAIHGDAVSLPFRSGSLLHIFSSNTFEHIWYLKDAAIELFRCIENDGKAIIVIPTEGGLWNWGRRFLSKPHFSRKYPDIDFDFISHVEHCNEARQVIRTLETFFNIQRRYIPTRIPSMMINVLVELHLESKYDQGRLRIGVAGE